MINEKITTKIAPGALNQMLNLFEQSENQTELSAEGFFDTLNDEALILKYPQILDDSQYIGVFVRQKNTDDFIQFLVIRTGTSQTILEILQYAHVVSDENLLSLNLTFTTEEGFSFSETFDEQFFLLDIHHQQLDIMVKMDSWLTYIEFLTTRLDYPYTIEKSNQLGNNLLEITLADSFKWENADNVSFYSASNNQALELGKVTSFEPETSRFILENSLQNNIKAGDLVYIYNDKQRQELMTTYHELNMLRISESEMPKISHPLLNPFYPKNDEGDFYGVAAKTEDINLAIETITNQLLANHKKVNLAITDRQIEQKLIDEHVDKLPIDSNQKIAKALSYYKQPILEKSAIKKVEYDNVLSLDERKIQEKSIAYHTKQFEVTEQRIKTIVDVKEFLDSETQSNNQTIKDFETAISGYEKEQEELAFQNHQLILAKEDIEFSLTEQQIKLKNIENKKNEDQQYYNDLEEEWLLFNKESHLFTKCILSLKDIEKSDQIIEECQGKLDKIEDDQKVGQNYEKLMDDEFNNFKENQQIERIELLIKNVKNTAEYLNIPVDLQFATSYAELTNIYLTKYDEIEHIENRFEYEVKLVEAELEKQNLKREKPYTTSQSYDRNVAEDVFSHVKDTVENRPLTLGVNYKSKQRWKEQLVEAAADMYIVLLCMKNEKDSLESKLMSQLQYAEQLLNYFELDITAIKNTMEYHQINLQNSHNEYSEIISAAKMDKEEMMKVVNSGLKESNGRSEEYKTVYDIDAARKKFKEELMSKYESLESKDVEIDSIQKTISALSTKLSSKITEVQFDKEEMDAQIDVLQHDVVNTKKNIVLLHSANDIIFEQLEQLEVQSAINTEEGSRFVSKITAITENLAEKESQKEMVTIKRHQIVSWQEKLQDDTNQEPWYDEIFKNSKLSFTSKLAFENYFEADVVVVEDQQFTWVNLLQNYNPQQKLVFVTDNLQQRSPIALEDFDRYLEQQNIPFQKRKTIVAKLIENPFTPYAKQFEIPAEKPYLVHSNDDKISS